jgi:uncharacterized protein YdhG (YjbR/CyaY superfamily)
MSRVSHRKPAKAPAASVREYLAALEPEQWKAMKAVLTAVRKAVPDAQPVISYGIPALRLGRVFFYGAAFKRHIGIYPPVRSDARLMRAIKPYANAKGNLAFPLGEPLPLPLIVRVAKALARQYSQPESPRPRRKSGVKRPRH